MKRITLSFLIFLSAMTYGQDALNYQAVIRDVTNTVVSNAEIGFEFGILLGGTQVYAEEHTVFTDQNGQLNLRIGNGIPVSGDFNSIEWGTAYMEILIRCDINGDDIYDIITTEALQSVPFAHYAKTAVVAQTSEDNHWVGDESAIGTESDDTKVGIGTAEPNTSLEVHGAVSVSASDEIIEVNSDDFLLSIGNNTYLKISSNDALASGRTVLLSEGLAVGQLLVLEGVMPAGNALEMIDNSAMHVNLKANYVLGNADTITLIWNGSIWIELFRSENE